MGANGQVDWKKGAVRQLIDDEITTYQSKRTRARSKRSKDLAAAKVEALQVVRTRIFGEPLEV